MRTIGLGVSTHVRHDLGLHDYFLEKTASLKKSCSLRVTVKVTLHKTEMGLRIANLDLAP